MPKSNNQPSVTMRGGKNVAPHFPLPPKTKSKPVEPPPKEPDVDVVSPVVDSEPSAAATPPPQEPPSNDDSKT